MIQWQSSPYGLNNWTDISGENAPNLVVTPNDTTDYRAFLTSDPFQPDSSNTITIYVYELPQASISGDTTICEGNSANLKIELTGDNPWYLEYSDGVDTFSIPGINSSPYFITVNPLSATTYYLVTVGDVHGCNGTVSGTATVNVDEQPVANAGVGGDECDFDFVLNATASVGTGTWTKTAGSGKVVFAPNANAPNATVTVDAYDTYQFTWTELNGTCIDNASVTVNFYEQPVANAGSGGDECDPDFVLNATASVGTGTWTKTAGSGNAVFAPNANTPNATVTVDAYDTYQFTWTELNGTCTDNASVTVNFYEQPAANAGPGGDECDLDFALQATPSVGTGTWTKTSGPGTATFTPNENDPNATVTVSAYGTCEFTWTEVNGACSDNDAVTVNFYEQPVADAGVGGDECDLDYALHATPSAGTGTWTKTLGPGTASFTPDAGTPNALVTVDAYGSYEFTWTEVNGTCSDDSTITVNFYEPPVADAGQDVSLCSGEESKLNASGGIFYSWNPATGLSDPGISNPIASPIATTTYFVTVTDNNGCENFDELTVVVHKQPIANAGPDQELDYIFETTMEAELSSLESGEWSVVSGSGKFGNKNSPVSMVTGLSLGENIFIWKVTNEVCPEAADEVKITVSDFLVPSVITPNGDNKNDYFVVRGIGNFDSSELIVFNRWGAEIYKNENYKNDWDGRDHNGNELPDDTYFFILNIKNVRVIKGYVVIKR